MDFIFINAAVKEFQNLDVAIQSQISKKLNLMKDDKLFLNNLIPFKGSRFANYRVRVGNYRLLVKVNSEKKQTLILSVAHRREVYSKFD